LLLFRPGLAGWLGLLAAFAAVGGGRVFGDDAEGQGKLRTEIATLIRQLDADQFATRRQAFARLQQLRSRVDAATTLAEEFHKALLSPQTPFEVRRQVERLASGLPRAATAPQPVPTAEEIDRLVAQLDDNQYGVRLGASRRLEWLLEQTESIGTIYGRLKARLNDPGLSLDARRWLEPVYVKARGAWLRGDPSTWPLPAVAPSQIEAWIERLASPAPDPNAIAASRDRETALRELQDLLALDDYAPRVQQALETRLARGNLDARATRDLTGLLDLCRPAMVAEYWQARRHLNTQRLWIGVPKREGQAERASHFDYVDDDTAFCVSGQNLSPGNHRVGIAFAHPKAFGAMFHLVNLSTPRQKMAYAAWSQRDSQERLAQITRRTLGELLAAKQRLSLEELFLLEQLDPAEVSRFAGEHFLLVEDQAIPEAAIRAYVGRPPSPGNDQGGALFDSVLASRHGMLCYRLALDGDNSAIPNLLRALEKNRFLPPSAKAPHRLPWIAAMAIAARDPWPGADAWLARLVESSESLIVGRDPSPELGATAAAILLAQHGEEPSLFQLSPVADPLLERVRLLGCRFAVPQGRQRVLQWWSARQNKPIP